MILWVQDSTLGVFDVCRHVLTSLTDSSKIDYFDFLKLRIKIRFWNHNRNLSLLTSHQDDHRSDSFQPVKTSKQFC